MEQIILESELEPKTLDAWSQSRSLEISDRLQRPDSGYCSVAYDTKCIC